jgi:uncharacterized protein (TIGR03083 family)
MAESNPWPTIHAERAALAADLESLSDEQWNMPSWCAGWSVREVLGHMTSTAGMTTWKFVTSWAGTGFRFNVMNERNAAGQLEGTPADTLARFNAVLSAETHPPGPVDAMLGEVVVHAADIRRPLEIPHEYPPETLIRVADFFRRSNLILGSKTRVAGLTLRASDTEWGADGAGPEVTGPMLALVMVMTGRPAALRELSGNGLDTLRSRLPPPA